MKQDYPLVSGALAWAYLRVSGDGQAKRITPIASQRKAVQQGAALAGISLHPVPASELER